MLIQDFRYALRVLLKNPAFALVAVFSLALGIGANSAMFSLADALLLRPLPVLRPSEIVSVQTKTPKSPFGGMSYRDYVDYRDHSRAFEGLVAFNMVPFGFSPRPDALPQVKYGLLVTGNFFQAMGIQPELGRGFRLQEDQAPGRDAVVVLGHDFWQKEFGGDRSVVGRTIRLNGVDFSVIGVMPEKFTGMDQYFHVAMMVPMMMSPRLTTNLKLNLLEQRDARVLQVKGRLKPGVTIAQAQAELTGIAKGIEQAHPDTNREQGVAIRTELQMRIEQSPPDATLVAMLLTLSALVLLVACANVASLLLSRARSRSREMAVRLAIGAGRIRLVRQLLTESLFIGLAGGLLGLAVARLFTVLLNRVEIPSDLPFVLSVQLDQRVLLFSLAASLVSVLLFGLAPAIQTSRADLVRSLKAADADASGKRRVWGRNLLVVGQVAVSVVLLVVAAMLYRGFRTELGSGPGFRHDHVAMMSFDPSLVRFNETQTQQFYKQAVDHAISLTGVKSAALTSVIPMSPNQNGESIVPEGYQFPKDKTTVSLFKDVVDEHFFDTMAVPIVQGRAFGPTDSASAPKVAIVNEVVAKKYWPNQDAVGKRFRLGDPKGPWVQIVGVAKTGKYLWIAEPPLEYLYLPFAQNPQTRMTLVAESFGDAAGLIPPLREMVRGIDPNQPIYDVRTIEDFYQRRAVNTPNVIMQTVGSLGLMGLILAMVGLYGLVAYSVSRRTREFGIRMAIGAGSGHVLRIVLRQGLILSLTGITIGLVASLGAGRVLRAAFQSAQNDPVALVIVPPLLFLVTMLAAYAPAYRASRVDPVKALRYE